MSNTAFTELVIEGKYDDVLKLQNELIAIVDDESDEILVQNNWLCNLFKNDEKIYNFLGNKDSRSFINFVNEEILEINDLFSITASLEEAWCSRTHIFPYIEKKYNVEIYFLSEEASADYFVTNDIERKHFKTNYYFDFYENSMFDILKEEKEATEILSKVIEIIENNDNEVEGELLYLTKTTEYLSNKGYDFENDEDLMDFLNELESEKFYFSVHKLENDDDIENVNEELFN